jgi:hypothetical protein
VQVRKCEVVGRASGMSLDGIGEIGESAAEVYGADFVDGS